MIYPDRFIYNDIAEAVSLLGSYSVELKNKEESRLVKEWCSGHFSKNILLPEFDHLVERDIDRGKIREKIKGIVSHQQEILDEKNKVVRENMQLKKEMGKLIETSNRMKATIQDLNKELKTAKKQHLIIFRTHYPGKSVRF